MTISGKLCSCLNFPLKGALATDTKRCQLDHFSYPQLSDLHRVRFRFQSDLNVLKLFFPQWSGSCHFICHFTGCILKLLNKYQYNEIRSLQSVQQFGGNWIYSPQAKLRSTQIPTWGKIFICKSQAGDTSLNIPCLSMRPTLPLPIDTTHTPHVCICTHSHMLAHTAPTHPHTYKLHTHTLRRFTSN